MKKRALIISASTYRDKYFSALEKTTADAKGLAKVLKNAEHGAFDSVETHIDAEFSEVNRAVLRFYRKAEKDDLLLLYFCGHGARNAKGGLYLALVDTEIETLEASALDCAKLRNYMEDSRCKRQLVILDCCNSGDFASSRQATPLLVDIHQQLAPAPGNLFDPSKQEGRFVLTATKKGALAFERFEGAPTSPYSPYAQALIEGFSSHVAHNEQGHITVNSLHRYVNQQVTNLSKGEQHPQIMSLINDGDLLLVKSKLKPLPEDIVALLENKDPEQREFGLIKLGRLCHEDERFIPAAHNSLEDLCKDRDSLVKSEALKLRDKLIAQQAVTQPQKQKTPSATPPKRPRFPSPDFAGIGRLLTASPSKEELKEAKAELYDFVSANREHKEARRLLAKVHNALNALVEREKLEAPSAQAAANTETPKKRRPWAVASVLGVSFVLVMAWAWELKQRQAAVKEALPEVALADAGTLENRIESEAVATRIPTLVSTPQPTAKSPIATSKKTSKSEFQAGQVFQDELQSGALGPKMVVIPAGEFRMGSPADEPGRELDEGPQHKVRIKAFAMGQTEVTFADYDRFAKATGRTLPSDGGWGRGRRPAINVSWNDAQAFIQWLNQQSGQSYRLPSEAEWEYAARAGSTAPFSTGGCITGEQANFGGNSNTPYANCAAHNKPPKQIVEVATYPANNFGLYDMHGNVWEWVEDCWHSTYKGAPSGGSAWLKSDDDCSSRVLRGGSWGDFPRRLRSAKRFRSRPDERFSYVGVGFRLARTL